MVAALLNALVGHRSLDAASAGVLITLLAADAPALTELSVSRCNLSVETLGLLCAALPRSSHLHALDMGGLAVPDGFMRDRLLPAVRANSSLRMLLIDRYFLNGDDDDWAVDEAERIVDARADAYGLELLL